MINKHIHAGFSMITAIFVILLMSAVGAFVLNISGKAVQETTTQYRKEQAILYAKSYTEFAIMSATARDCITGITANIGNPANGNGYQVTVDANYIGNDLSAAGCANTFGGAIASTFSRGGILMLDTYVRYKDPDGPNPVATPWITYHKRTLQRL